jgi:hypothetical protein
LTLRFNPQFHVLWLTPNGYYVVASLDGCKALGNGETDPLQVIADSIDDLRLG